MPQYDYECSKCGKVFEFFKRMEEEPLVWCMCGGKATQLLSLVSTHKDKLYEFSIQDSKGQNIEFRSKGQFEKYLKDNHKYQIIHNKDFDIEKKRIDTNQKDIMKRETRKVAEQVYRQVKSGEYKKRW